MQTIPDEVPANGPTIAGVRRAHETFANRLEQAAMGISNLNTITVVSRCAQRHRKAGADLRSAANEQFPALSSRTPLASAPAGVDSRTSDPFTLLVQAEREERRCAQLAARCAVETSNADLAAILREHARRFAAGADELRAARAEMRPRAAAARTSTPLPFARDRE